MASQSTFMGLSCLLVLCAVASAQVYVRGDKEGPYRVPGVAGIFERSPSKGTYSYTDESGSTFVHNKNGAGPATHAVKTPDFVAQNGPAPYATYRVRRSPDTRTVLLGNDRILAHRVSRSPTTYAAPPPDDDTEIYEDGKVVGRHSEVIFDHGGIDFDEHGAEVLIDNGGLVGAPRARRSPDTRTVLLGNDRILAHRTRRSPTTYAAPPRDETGIYENGRLVGRRDSAGPPRGREVLIDNGGLIGPGSNGGYRGRRSPESFPEPTGCEEKGCPVVHDHLNSGTVEPRGRRSPSDGVVLARREDGRTVIFRTRRAPDSFHIARPDGRSVTFGDAGSISSGVDGRTVVHRQKRQKVQGENFVANGDQAGIWGDDISVWKRPNGRTVSVDRNGKVLVTGRFGTQVYTR